MSNSDRVPVQPSAESQEDGAEATENGAVSSDKETDTPTMSTPSRGDGLSVQQTILNGMFESHAGNGTAIKRPSKIDLAPWSVPALAQSTIQGVSLPFLANTANLHNGLWTQGQMSNAGGMQHGPGSQLPATGHLTLSPGVHSTDLGHKKTLLSSEQIAARQVLNKDLPVFSGKPEEWLLFISHYEQSTERCGISNEENLIRLQKCLKGAAWDAVRGKLMCPETVPYAIGTLRMLYGRPEIIHSSLQRKLREEPAARSNNLDSVIQLALAVQNYCATLVAIGLKEYLHDPALLGELVEKLPGELKLDWGRHRMTLIGCVANLSIFDNWLFGIAMCASMVTPYTVPAKDGAKRTKERIFLHNELQSGSSQESKTQEVRIRLCPKCAGSHNVADCRLFREMSIKQRKEFVRQKRLCYCCFDQHVIRNCKSKRSCGVDGCRQIHHSLIHETADYKESKSQWQTNEDDKPVHPPILFHGDITSKALFRYMPITLYGRKRNLATYALLDEGAACSLIEETLADELGLDGPAEELCLKWTSQVTQTESASKYVSVGVSSMCQGATQFELKSLRTVRKLDLPTQTVTDELVTSRKHLQYLPNLSYCNVKASLIIGLDNLKVCVPLEIRESEGDDVVAARCRLGWSVYGRHSDAAPASPHILHICECNEASSMRALDASMKEYFAMESSGTRVPSKPLRSKDDERALQIMEATTSYCPIDKRWQTGLLWRFDRVDLPDSYSMAMRRLQCLEAKMAKDIDLRSFMLDIMQSYEEKGYIRRLTESELNKGKSSWFLPIFTVTNPNKNKTRLVWDAAAKVNGTSLNDVLLKGPDILASLVGVLIRFRERPVAVAGDISEMFHQVRVRPEDQTAQKFLWRNGNSAKAAETYVMQVMTFGASCSPALANYIKNRNAERFRKESPRAVAAICRNTFVDDWLESTNTEDEMTELAMEVQRIHLEGGFNMRRWTSNSASVVRALKNQEGDVPREVGFLEKTQDKVLGMWWLPVTDQLTYVVKPDLLERASKDYPTKRTVLSVVMSIFDPLGLLGFFTVRAKIILQNIWRAGTDWDESLQEEDQADWKTWVKLLPKINEVRISRCMPKVCCARRVQLHTFVDASINAYAALVYLRAEVDGIVHCSLVASKTRVAPLKPVSIPRMELMAAVLGLRLTKFIEPELSVTVCQRIFWTDSKDVLCWIRSDARKYNQFVALRVGEILEDSDVLSWRWVPTQHNVADDGTKWTKMPDMTGNSRWFVGPRFLYEQETQWPSMEQSPSKTSESILHHEEKVKGNSSLACITPDPERFGTLEKLRAVQKRVLNFLQGICKRPCGEKLMNILAINRDVETDAVFIRACQEEEFPEEIRCLNQGHGITNRKSKLFKCTPYLDELGVLRIKGRIDRIEGVDMDTKRPIILPQKHRVTFLIVEYYHRKNYHLHNEIVVNEVRQRYWITGLRALVRKVANACVACRIRVARPVPPKMGDLPKERLSPHTQPFTFTGVDCFGPFEVAVGRRHEKRWGVLFTCLTTRAVHLEIATSLSTDSFLCVLKAFVARRGVPRTILSDNGTNFRGASRVLKEHIERISTSAVEQQYPTLEFKFNPPSSPHMGGVWERLVRSTKSILSEILPKAGLKEEVLRGAFADVEQILNSRPLTYVPLESAESEALTPNHFLKGSSSGLRENGSLEQSGPQLAKGYRVASQIADRFWKRWLREYLPTITRRTKWFQPQLKPVAVGDVVIIVDDSAKRNTWPKGRVIEVHRGKDGQVRSAVVRTVDGLVTRPTVKLAVLNLESNPPREDAGELRGGECCGAGLIAAPRQ
ncbi:uncharacterized protein [Drosophila tropicalis]|uniref:uncharacterized protein n=1 Tax=Drosophila tropicalis TaxID=46794 RepID=UPI0035ABE2CF